MVEGDLPAVSEAVIKGTGLTESEQHLAALAKRTFLDLWSFPNLFKAPGQELCDLLVVCGDEVLIFSDKAISWPSTADVATAWKRWYRKAIEKSAAQVRGAARWLAGESNRVFLDSACTKPFPLGLPANDRRRVHGIVVARGSAAACKAHFGRGSGSLRIRSELTGQDHTDSDADLFAPFAIGDVSPEGPFVHVLDDNTLEILLSELDTISDFTAYLERKVGLLRSGASVFADGEEDMLAEYLRATNADDRHDFVKGDGSEWKNGDVAVFERGIYATLKDDPRYLLRKEADRNSYVWDELVQSFSEHLLKGTTVPEQGGTYELSEAERALRLMALENRVMRRGLGEAFLGAARHSGEAPRFIRASLPLEKDARDTGFFFLFLAVPTHLPDITYDRYREVRRDIMKAYGLSLLERNRHLKRLVGIAMEPPAAGGGSSEDLGLIEVDTWTPGLLADVQLVRQHYGIMQEGRYQERHVHFEEYPIAELPRSRPKRLNHKQRRLFSAMGKPRKRS